MTRPPESIPGARLLFSLDPTVTHLNHGALGAVPIPVQRAQRRLHDEVDANPQRFFTRGLADRVAHSRRHLAAFLGADPDGSALVANATAGVAVVLNSIRLRPGDEVVTTDHGYGAVDLAVHQLCAATGAEPRRAAVPLTADDEEIVAAITSAVGERTRLLVVDQVTSPTARLMPVARIVAGVPGVPVLVDAAHAPGMLPVDVASIGADFWVGNLHKWMFAPRGTALLHVAPRWRDGVRPLVVSWEQPAGFPRAVEFQGTVDYSPWLAAPTGLFTIRSLGVERVREHNVALAAYGQQVVGDALGVPSAELPDPGGQVSMRLVPLPPGLATTQAAAEALRARISDELRVEVAVTAWRGHGLLRLSAQVYNRAGDYERLAEGLPRLLAAR